VRTALLPIQKSAVKTASLSLKNPATKTECLRCYRFRNRQPNYTAADSKIRAKTMSLPIQKSTTKHLKIGSQKLCLIAVIIGEFHER
jgi:hypothetical protein